MAEYRVRLPPSVDPHQHDKQEIPSFSGVHLLLGVRRRRFKVPQASCFRNEPDDIISAYILLGSVKKSHTTQDVADYVPNLLNLVFSLSAMSAAAKVVCTCASCDGVIAMARLPTRASTSFGGSPSFVLAPAFCVLAQVQLLPCRLIAHTILKRGKRIDITRHARASHGTGSSCFQEAALFVALWNCPQPRCCTGDRVASCRTAAFLGSAFSSPTRQLMLRQCCPVFLFESCCFQEGRQEVVVSHH